MLLPFRLSILLIFASICSFIWLLCITLWSRVHSQLSEDTLTGFKVQDFDCRMRNSERLQHEMDSTLGEVETFLHDLSLAQLPQNYNVRRQKLESKVKLLRAKYRLHLHRVPLASLRFIYDPFPKDLEVIKRPRSLTSPDTMATYLPDVPEEEEACSPGPGNQPGKLDKDIVICDSNDNIIQGLRPRSASFPLTL